MRASPAGVRVSPGNNIQAAYAAERSRAMSQDKSNPQATQQPAVDLTTRAMLLNLTITAWTARRTDKEAGDAVAAKYGSDATMGRYRKYLIDPAAIDPIINFATSCRDEFRRRTAPWGDNGDRIIEARGYPGFLSEFTRRRDTWDDMLADFFGRYPQLVNDAAVKLNGLWRQGEYPTMRQLTAKFSFGWDIAGVNADWRVTLGADEDARIRRQIEERIKARTDAAMVDLASKIRDVVGHMTERLRAYQPATADGKSTGRFHDTLVQNIRELVDVIPALNITGSAEITDLAARMRADLCKHDADTLRESPAVRSQVAAAADEILATLGGVIA